MRLPIYKYLSISTSHIRKETDEFLKSEAKNTGSILTIYEGMYGFLLYVPNSLHLFQNDIPSDLMDCFKFAESHGCTIIEFDCDGVVIEELPVYDW